MYVSNDDPGKNQQIGDAVMKQSAVLASSNEAGCTATGTAALLQLPPLTAAFRSRIM
jgi:hypothetical protein